ncbi:hypothetical protein AAE02nite_04120 [Adhaeribacter aerolatus]|uniref:Outer membrane protein beta-barrel domain-containing protein n=1 Tax=Adhaeribacter aerolatus TaxID=670289 RepID=A0A512ASR6_9BACT|nr:hypothetical protein [Adhaeribacter aerolatus]GEO02748.1 hypothetical protein AAE02nite_04120 [Adhaeribacter aerolatus]
MKKNAFTHLLAAVLLCCSLGSLSAQDLKQSQLSISYRLSHLTFLDQQASPLIYQANLNGVAVAYEHSAPKSRSFINFQANLGTALPKGIGMREFTFTGTDFYGETTTTKLLHAPTIYVGQLEAGYLRRLKTGGTKSIFVGGTLQNWIAYSDNIGFWSTMGINTASLNAAIQYEKKLSPKQQFKMGASFPVVAIVSRMPYSNVISAPERGNFEAFFTEGSQLTSLHHYQRLNLHAAYSYRLSRHWQTGLAYNFTWLHYTHPQPIRVLNQALNIQVNYLF